MAAQRPPSQLQTQQQQQQQAAQARAAAAAQRHMGMQHAMLMSGGNPAATHAAAHALNVGVPSYMPLYQLPQMPPGGAPEPPADQGAEGKHGE